METVAVCAFIKKRVVLIINDVLFDVFFSVLIYLGIFNVGVKCAKEHINLESTHAVAYYKNKEEDVAKNASPKIAVRF